MESAEPAAACLYTFIGHDEEGKDRTYRLYRHSRFAGLRTKRRKAREALRPAKPIPFKDIKIESKGSMDGSSTTVVTEPSGPIFSANDTSNTFSSEPNMVTSKEVPSVFLHHWQSSADANTVRTLEHTHLNNGQNLQYLYQMSMISADSTHCTLTPQSSNLSGLDRSYPEFAWNQGQPFDDLESLFVVGWNCDNLGMVEEQTINLHPSFLEYPTRFESCTEWSTPITPAVSDSGLTVEHSSSVARCPILNHQVEGTLEDREDHRNAFCRRIM